MIFHLNGGNSMAIVKIDPAGLEQQAAEFNEIIRNVEEISEKIFSNRRTLILYSGYGLVEIKERLEKTANSLKKCSKDLDCEQETLKKIVEYSVNADREAYGVISWKPVESGNNNNADTEKITVTHEDFEKILKQFKYYSTRNDATRRFYEFLKGYYDTGNDYVFTRKIYDLIKNTFNVLTHKGDHEAFVYSNIAPAADGSFKTFDDHYNQDIINAEGKASVLKMEYAYGCDGSTTTYTIEFGTLSGNAKVSLEWFRDFMSGNESMFEKALSGEEKDKSLDFIIAEISAKVGADLTGLTISSVTTKKISDTASIYSAVNLTVGKLYAEAGAEAYAGSKGVTLSASAKIGANVASIESETGIITNDELISGSAGLNAGQEWGVEAKLPLSGEGEKGGKVSIGAASVAFDIKDGFGYYEWL